jgi:hypothetical protein
MKKRFLQTQRYFNSRSDIAFAYLFGSIANGKSTGLSDIDIAVYLLKGDFAKKRLDILGALIDIFKIDGIDLVVLNSASPSLKIRIIRSKKVLSDNMPFLRRRFESSVIRTYFDFSKIESRILEKRYLHG